MAKAKTDKEMVTRSIYIERDLYEKLLLASGRAGASLVITYLVKKWLNGEINLEIPRVDFLYEGDK